MFAYHSLELLQFITDQRVQCKWKRNQILRTWFRTFYKWWRWRHPSPCSSFNLFYAQSPWLSEVHSRIFTKIYAFLKPDKKGSFWHFSSAEWYWNGTFHFSILDVIFIEFFIHRIDCPFSTLQQIIPASGLVMMPALNLPWFCQKCKLKCLKTPDFYSDIPDNRGTVPDKRFCETDFHGGQMDKSPRHSDRGIRTFTLKSPCPDGKNP